MLVKLGDFLTTKQYKAAWLSAWSAKSALQRFLAYRCSKEFLSLYLAKNPLLLEEVSEPGLYLSAVSEVDLAVRLHEFGLLPEDKRKKFITTVSKYAIQGEDLYALDNRDILQLFEETEFEDLVQKVRSKLLTRLDDVRRDFELNHNSDQSPEEHMQPLFESFEILKKRFGDDLEIEDLIERETRLANEWITENTQDDLDRKPRALGKVETADKPLGSRSIFDDIDI